MALFALELAIDLGLTAAGYGEYTTTGALLEIANLITNAIMPQQRKNYDPRDPGDVYQLTTEEIRDRDAELARKYFEKFPYLLEEVERRPQSVQDLANRAKLIVKLPTRKIDAKQLKKLGIKNVANRTVEDPLALRKLEMEKLNAETLARAQLRDTRNKEMLENAAEQQAKRLARQQQIEGSTNLLSQIQNRASAESANLQQIQNQEQSLIQKSQSDTAAANAAVLKAEQAQLAKNTIIPVRRLPKSVKYGGGKKSILERLMTEFDMTLKEAKQLIKLYGI